MLLAQQPHLENHCTVGKMGFSNQSSDPNQFKFQATDMRKVPIKFTCKDLLGAVTGFTYPGSFTTGKHTANEDRGKIIEDKSN